MNGPGPSIQCHPPGYVMLAVTDTGCGMDDKTKDPHLRALFHHERTGEGNRPGSGHGLRDREAKRRRHPRGKRA